MTKQSLRRVAEYSFLSVFLWQCCACISWSNPLFELRSLEELDERLIVPGAKAGLSNLSEEWPELLVLLIWCSTPIFLRPLTTQGVSTQQRYVVAGLTASAGLVWWIWLGPLLWGSGRRFAYSLHLAERDGLPLLGMLGLLALAGYFRIGWQSDRGSETDRGPTKSSDGR
jgi:hypothetical protein